MIIVFGSKVVLKCEGTVKQRICTNCGKSSEMSLSRVVKQFTLYGLPVMSITKQRGELCRNCGDIRPLEKKEYELKKRENKELEKTMNG